MTSLDFFEVENLRSAHFAVAEILPTTVGSSVSSEVYVTSMTYIPMAGGKNLTSMANVVPGLTIIGSSGIRVGDRASRKRSSRRFAWLTRGGFPGAGLAGRRTQNVSTGEVSVVDSCARDRRPFPSVRSRCTLLE